MQALMVSKPKMVAVAQIDDPAPAPGEVVVTVTACGVCGTDRHIVEGTYPAQYPIVLGHEFAGTVSVVGAGVDSFAVGDRVAVDPNISDGTCPACKRGEVNLCENLSAIGVTRAGGMAPFVAVPVTQLHRVPNHLSLEDAAFAEPLSCIIHGLDRVKALPGATVAILGAGSIGLLTQQAVCKFAGSVIVSEPNAARRELAESLGADEVYTPEMIEHDSHTEEYDLVIDCTGSPTALLTAIRLARRGADVLVFGVSPAGAKVQVEPYELYRKELRLVASNLNPFTMDKAITMLADASVKVEGVVSHTVGLDELPQLLLAAPPPGEVKAALRFS